jgi:tRNA threonylcarbamoyladenosine biosynthesis protein TsaE
MKMKKISNSVAETNKIAKEFAQKISKIKNKKSATVIALSGDLGSGKTTFTKAFAKELGIKKHITSPTFVLMKAYVIPNTSLRLLHMDAYRFAKSADVLGIGWKEILKNSNNLVMVEWPENIKKALPKSYFLVKFTHLEKNKRGVDIESKK